MTKRIVGTARTKKGRRRVGVLGLALAAFALMIVAASANLTGSSFEGNDGNMILNNASNKDWINAPNLTQTPDLFNTGADDSIEPGTKEDDNCANIISHKPPPKDDFKNVAYSTETVSGQTFLYVSTIRRTANGSAHENLELNKGTSGVCTNSDLFQRVAGDRLITIDYTNGGVSANFNLMTWKTSGTCFEAPAPPCWGDFTPLGPSVAEGSTNAGGGISAANNPLTNVALGTNEFAEFAVNLTGAGIVQSGVCTTFASAIMKARSSGNSFTSNMNDVVLGGAPITNCGVVNIHKEDDVGNPLAGVTFTLFTDNAPLDGAAPHGAEDTATTFTCTTDASGDCSIVDVPFGQYWVVEGTPPSGHNAAADQNIILSPSALTVSLTFVNPRQPASVSIHKQDDLGNALGGAVFTLFTDNAPLNGSPPHGAEDTATALTCTTNASGDCTIPNVPLGQYWVVETTGVPGHSLAPDQNINLTTGGQSVTLTFVDPRQHRVIVLVCHQGTNTLAASDVTYNSADPKTTLAAGATLPDGVSEAELCGLGGANYSGKSHGSASLSVDVGSDAHP